MARWRPNRPVATTPNSGTRLAILSDNTHGGTDIQWVDVFCPDAPCVMNRPGYQHMRPQGYFSAPVWIVRKMLYAYDLVQAAP